MPRLLWVLVMVNVLATCLTTAPAWGVEVNPPLPTGTVVIADRVTVSAELARSMVEQTRGLSGRPGLQAGHGMLFMSYSTIRGSSRSS